MSNNTPPDGSVRGRLSRHMLVDGLPLIYDPVRSHGHWLADAESGDEFLDMFSFFASAALGHNHPVFDESEVRSELAVASRVKPSLSDIVTESSARFVETVSRITPDSMPHHFFVEGGALAVENALKTAFDWKVRKNLEAGRGEKGRQIIHFTGAFHGRSGYTLSLTNTASKSKTQYFPKFTWPRVEAPVRQFPETAVTLESVAAEETKAVESIELAFKDHPDDIAAIIIEPIQSEGGDRHFRPEFLVRLRELADTHETLLIFDEIQTGLGLTGHWWAHQGLGVEPDIICFAKKMQVGGIAATTRVDDIDSVFSVSSRINSTFGGNLTDMVRARVVLETMERENLVANAAGQGENLLADTMAFVGRHQGVLSAARGRGLMVAFDCPDTTFRDCLVAAAYDKRLLILGCGERTIRFRPFLNITDEVRGELMSRLEAAMSVVRGAA